MRWTFFHTHFFLTWKKFGQFAKSVRSHGILTLSLAGEGMIGTPSTCPLWGTGWSSLHSEKKKYQNFVIEFFWCFFCEKLAFDSKSSETYSKPKKLLWSFFWAGGGGLQALCRIQPCRRSLWPASRILNQKSWYCIFFLLGGGCPLTPPKTQLIFFS